MANDRGDTAALVAFVIGATVLIGALLAAAYGLIWERPAMYDIRCDTTNEVGR